MGFESETREELARLGIAEPDIDFLEHVVAQTLLVRDAPRKPTPKAVQQALQRAEESTKSLIATLDSMGEESRRHIYFELALRELEGERADFTVVGDLDELRARLVGLLPSLRIANPPVADEGNRRGGRPPGEWQDRALMALRLVLLGMPSDDALPRGTIRQLAEAIDLAFGPDTFADSRGQAKRALTLIDTYDLHCLRARFQR